MRAQGIGSINKTFTASVILQPVDEGEPCLDDTLATADEGPADRFGALSDTSTRQLPGLRSGVPGHLNVPDAVVASPAAVGVWHTRHDGQPVDLRQHGMIGCSRSPPTSHPRAAAHGPAGPRDHRRGTPPGRLACASRGAARSPSPSSGAGSMILLASVGPGDRVATADPDVLAVAASEAIETIALPSQG